jgi:hypothetical protein
MRKMLFAAECFSGRVAEYGASRPSPLAFFCLTFGILFDLELDERDLCRGISRKRERELTNFVRYIFHRQLCDRQNPLARAPVADLTKYGKASLILDRYLTSLLNCIKLV